MSEETRCSECGKWWDGSRSGYLVEAAQSNGSARIAHFCSSRCLHVWIQALEKIRRNGDPK